MPPASDPITYIRLCVEEGFILLFLPAVMKRWFFVQIITPLGHD